MPARKNDLETGGTLGGFLRGSSKKGRNRSIPWGMMEEGKLHSKLLPPEGRESHLRVKLRVRERRRF